MSTPRYISVDDSLSSRVEEEPLRLTLPLSKLTPREPGFSFPFGFDPLWIIQRLFEQWRIVLAVGGGAGCIFFMIAWLALSNRYTAPLQLMRESIPDNLVAGADGSPFRPRKFTDQTLFGILFAPEVIDRTAKALDPPQSFGQVRGALELETVDQADFVFLQANSTKSRADALALVATWAKEAVAFSRGLQRKEALNFTGYLRIQLANIEREISEINEQVIEHARRYGFVDNEKEMEAFLFSVRGLEQQLENAKIQLKAKDSQLNNYEREIRQQSPHMDQLKLAYEELNRLRGRYTDRNPLVREKIYEIAYLENLNQKSDGEGLARYTGTTLGNQLYLDIMSLRAEKIQFEEAVSNLEAKLKTERQRADILPRQMLIYSDLKRKKQALEEAAMLFKARLQEAELFAGDPPGYWRVLQEPAEAMVAVHKKTAKAFLWGIGGAMLGLMAAGGWIVIRTFFDRKVRTVFEVAAICKAKPLLSLKFSERIGEGFEQEDIYKFWISQLAPIRKNFALPAITLHGDARGELAFWCQLDRVMEEDGVKMTIVDVSLAQNNLIQKENFELLSENNLRVTSFAEVKPEEWETQFNRLEQKYRVFVRCKGVPAAVGVQVLEQKCDSWLAYVSLENIERVSLKNQIEFFSNVLQVPDGVIVQKAESEPSVLNDLRENWSTQIIQWLSAFSAKPKYNEE